MRTPRRFLYHLAGLLTLAASCSVSLQAQKKPPTDQSGSAPSGKEIIRLLLSMQDVPLSEHETCATAGTSLSDANLGDFVSGWLVELKKGRGQNWVDTSAKPTKLGPEQELGWQCTVMFRHVNGDDRWGWGVSFDMKASDRRPIVSSIRCLGAG
jgi:hypothetical protein